MRWASFLSIKGTKRDPLRQRRDLYKKKYFPLGGKSVLARLIEGSRRDYRRGKSLSGTVSRSAEFLADPPCQGVSLTKSTNHRKGTNQTCTLSVTGRRFS